MKKPRYTICKMGHEICEYFTDISVDTSTKDAKQKAAQAMVRCRSNGVRACPSNCPILKYVQHSQKIKYEEEQ